MSIPSYAFNATATQRGPGANLYVLNGVTAQNPVVIGTNPDPTQDYNIFGGANGFFITPPNWSQSTIDSLMYVDANLYRTAFMGTDVIQTGIHQIQAPFSYSDPFTPLLGPKVAFIQDGGDGTRMGVVGMSANFGVNAGTSTFNFPSTLTMGVYDYNTNVNRSPALVADITGVLKVPNGIQKCAPYSVSTIQGVYAPITNITAPATRQEVSSVATSGNAGTVSFASTFAAPPVVLVSGEFALNLGAVTTSNFAWTGATTASNIAYVNYIATGS